MKSIGRVWDQQYNCEVSMKRLGTKRIAVHFPGSVLGQQHSCEASIMSLVPAV